MMALSLEKRALVQTPTLEAIVSLAGVVAMEATPVCMSRMEAVMVQTNMKPAQLMLPPRQQASGTILSQFTITPVFLVRLFISMGSMLNTQHTKRVQIVVQEHLISVKSVPFLLPINFVLGQMAVQHATTTIRN